MAFELVPEEFGRFKVQHVRRVVTASVAATVLATHVYGTGSKMVPIHYRYAGSAAAAITLFNGSGGASIWTGNAVAANVEQWGPMWGITDMSGGNSIEWTAGTGIGNAYMELWWIVVPDTNALVQ